MAITDGFWPSVINVFLIVEAYVPTILGVSHPVSYICSSYILYLNVNIQFYLDKLNLLYKYKNRHIDKKDEIKVSSILSFKIIKKII